MANGIASSTIKTLAEFDSLCFGSEAMSESDWEKVFENENSYVFVHNPDGIVTGIAVARYDAGIGYLYSNAVHPDHRGKGIGTYLVAMRLEFFKQEHHRCARVQAHTRIGNKASQAVLAKCGFEPIQYVTDFYDDFEDGILWEKRLQ